ncbi:ATP-dependent rRNA helicase [Erysiphe necator]|uniref:ATP-dependent RNA helicase n=1 Tax=Uncinula necator TaxID=52586 RepID=A0A0B1NZC2_UNCNE|nr:ATP-dependent rRNA helicase [Erysiphe necator]KHJ31288.1 putative atp-dependent rrna helicase spb4 [Erysiphe necator]
MAPPSETKKDLRTWATVTPPLTKWIIDAVTTMGFAKMTPVQASTIPLFMGSKDVVVEAVTGSGKTFSYLIPVVEKLLRLDEPIKKHHIGAIILSPTRELATQIHSVLLSLLAFHGPSIEALNALSDEGKTRNTSECTVLPQLFLGGHATPAHDLSIFLKTSPNLIIATPGRLLDLLSSPYVHCPQSSFEVLVLDEADRLLDLGFKNDLQKILGRLPKQRRTGLFSASISEALTEIIRVGLRNPVKVTVRVKSTLGQDKRTPASLQLSYLITPPTHKLPALLSLLQKLEPTPTKTIIYLSTCAAVDYFHQILSNLLPNLFLLTCLHGKHSPAVRTRNFKKYTESVVPSILVTTDVAARGLDIPQVDLVIQVDPPSDPKVFLHRCGRAGRAGRRGISIIFLMPGREEDYILFLSIRQTPINVLQKPEIKITDLEASKIVQKIRSLVLSDRALYDKGQKAFVSWVKAYSKHQASSIFRLADLEWGQLGDAWGLLKLPKMPELKNWEGDKSLGVKFDMKRYAYKDKAREKLRLAALDKSKEKQSWNGGDEMMQKRKKIEAWSLKNEVREMRENRREKKRRKVETKRKARMTEEERLKEAEVDMLVEKVKIQNFKNDLHIA